MRQTGLDRLSVDPERALLTVLETALDMTSQFLLIAHPKTHDRDAEDSEHCIAYCLLTDADQLRRSLRDYFDLLDRNYALPANSDFPF